MVGLKQARVEAGLARGLQYCSPSQFDKPEKVDLVGEYLRTGMLALRSVSRDILGPL